MQRLIVVLLLLALFSSAEAQSNRKTTIWLGPVHNVSKQLYLQTTSLGLYGQVKKPLGVKWIGHFAIEQNALAYGILVLPGGCDGECKEGSNFLLNTYAGLQYKLGNDEKNFGYVGGHVLLSTHNRHIITSRVPGNYEDTRERVTSPGVGVALGYQWGKVDLNTSYNVTNSKFQNHWRFAIGIKLF